MSLAEVAELQRERDGLTAAAGPPLVPPREWFELPEPDEPTGWTVTADGQVYGHAALWGTCHTGKPGRCVTPPKSRSDYGYYQTGLTEVDDGELIPTGRITLGTGHASLTASPAATAEHYDNTGSVVADVRIRDGRHGIWVSGALRPTVTPERARELRGASLSGDWRNIRGALEMLGLLAVNVPGFPVPRAMTASGEGDEVLALVAAGTFERQDLYRETLAAAEPSDEEWEAAIEGVITAAGKSSRYMGKRAKVKEVMREFKAGKLKSSSGNKVTSRKQAVAIALSEANMTSSAAVTADSYEGDKQDLLDAGWAIRDEGDDWCLLESPGGEVRLVSTDVEPDEDDELIGSDEEKLYAAADPMNLPAARGVTAAAFDESKHPRKAKGQKGGGQWTVRTTNAEGRTSESSYSKETAEHDYRSVRDRNAFIEKGELIDPEGKTVSKFDRSKTTGSDSETGVSFGQRQASPTGKTKPVSRIDKMGGPFTYQGRAYFVAGKSGQDIMAEAIEPKDDDPFQSGGSSKFRFFPKSTPVEEYEWQFDDEDLYAAAFSEQDHPREGKGSEKGGQFTFKSSRTRVSDDEGASWRDETPEEYFADVERELSRLEKAVSGAEDDLAQSRRRGDMLAVRHERQEALEKAIKRRDQLKAQLEKERKEGPPKPLSAAGTQPCEECGEFDPMSLPAVRETAERRLEGGQLLAASFTGQQREKLAKKKQAMPDGSFPIRNRSDLRNAIASVGRAKDQAAARRWIIKRARQLKAVGDLPATWGITAAGTFDETKHPRHPKGSDKGGEFAPKDSLPSGYTGHDDDPESGWRMGRKMVTGPGGKLMSKTEKGVLLDKAEGRYVRSHDVTEAPLSEAAQEAAKLNPKSWMQIRDDMDLGDVEAQEVWRELQAAKEGVIGDDSRAMVTGPGGRQMSLTEAGIRQDAAEGRSSSSKASQSVHGRPAPGSTPATALSPEEAAARFPGARTGGEVASEDRPPRKFSQRDIDRMADKVYRGMEPYALMEQEDLTADEWAALQSRVEKQLIKSGRRRIETDRFNV